MAKQRINPEVQTDRVFQPVSQPVDLYYRPNLSAVELSRTGQIIDALKAFSPQLERFTSDIVAMNIATEKQVGAMEAMSGTVEAASAKAAKAIEGAGGVNPWRYEAFLDTMGRRMVREKYQASLYQNIEDLSALTNPDGTLRSGDYVTQKMSEFFTGVEIPQGSYFASRAAMDEKTKIDAQFLPMVQAKHADKLKAQNMQDLKDEMFGILDSQSTLHLADDGREAQAFQQQMRGVMERMRSLSGTSGAELYADALVEWANGKADEGDHEAARLALESSRKGDKFVVNGIELGAAHTAKLNSAIDAIDDKRSIDENQLLANRERNLATASRRAAASARQQAYDAVMQGVAQGKLPSFSLSPAQKQAMVDGFWESHSKDIHPDDKERFTSELYSNIDQVIQSANAPVIDNPNTVKFLMDQRRTGVDPLTYDKLVMDAAGRGEINLGTAMKMIEGYSSDEALVAIFPDYKALSRLTLEDFGLSRDRIDDAYASDMAILLSTGQSDLKSRIQAGIPDIMALPEEKRPAALGKLIMQAKREVTDSYKADYKDMLTQADKMNFEVTLNNDREYKAMFDGMVERLVTEVVPIDMVDEKFRGRANKELVTGLRSRVQDYLNSPEIVSLPLARRVQALKDSLPVIMSEYEAQLNSVRPNDTSVSEPIRRVLLGKQVQAVSERMKQAAQEAPMASETAQFRFPWSESSSLVQMRDMLPTDWIYEQRGGPAPYLSTVNVAQEIAKGTPGSLNVANRQIKETNAWFDRNISKILSTGTMASDGVYVNGKRDEKLSSFYDSALRRRGATAAEWASGKTKEGRSLDPAQFNWKTDTIFSSQAELQKARSEYMQSNGTEGVLVNMLGTYSSGPNAITSLDEFIRRQAAAVMMNYGVEQTTAPGTAQ